MSVIAYHFSSPTCAPCKIIKPVVDELKEDFPSITWHPVDISTDTSDLRDKYGVTVVPTIVVVSLDNANNQIQMEKHSGTQVAGYYRILRSALRVTQQS